MTTSKRSARSNRRIWFVLHSWAGLTAGLMLFVICWSGTVAVFAHEIDWLLNPAIRASTAPEDIPFLKAGAAVQSAHSHWRITEINAPRYHGFAIEVLVTSEADVRRRVYVDPVTFEVLGDTSQLNVQRFFRSFHMALFEASYFSVLGIPIGYLMVLVFAFPLLLSMMAPLFFYRRWWRGFFKLETRRGRRVFWSDVHKLSGVWSLWFIALICITSFWYLAEWFVPYAELPRSPELATVETLPLERLMEIAESAFPELNVTRVGLYAMDQHVLYLTGHDGTALTRGGAYLGLDTRTGELVDRFHSGDSGLMYRLIETVDVLHFGTFAGLWSQLLYAVFGLALSGLTLSGAYLQARRQAGKSDPRSLRAPVALAYATTIALLLMACLSGWSKLKGYGAHGQFPDVTSPVLVFLSAWIITTLAVLSVWVAKLR